MEGGALPVIGHLCCPGLVLSARRGAARHNCRHATGPLPTLPRGSLMGSKDVLVAKRPDVQGDHAVIIQD
eukprot:4301728-Alexandrium_andersonii.AAC.1